MSRVTWLQRVEAFLAENPEITPRTLGEAVGEPRVHAYLQAGLVLDHVLRAKLDMILLGQVRIEIPKAAPVKVPAPTIDTPAKRKRNKLAPDQTKGDGPPIDKTAAEVSKAAMLAIGCKDLLRRQMELGQHWLKDTDEIIAVREEVGLPALSDFQIEHLRAMQERLAAR
jgi:hypothetical protein